MLRLTDSQMHEVRQAALSVPWDLRGAFLEQLAVELRGKDLGDGLVHRVAHEVARAITWDAERTGATGFTSYIAAAAWRFSLPLLNARRRRVRNRLFIRISSACVPAPCSSPGSLGAALLFLCGGRPRGRPLALAMRRLRRRGSFRCNSATLRSEVAN